MLRVCEMPCLPTTRLNNDADVDASQDPGLGKGRKPLPHCNRVEDFASAPDQALITPARFDARQAASSRLISKGTEAAAQNLWRANKAMAQIAGRIRP